MSTDTLIIRGCSSVSTESFISFIARQKQLKTVNICGSRKILSGLKDLTEAVFDLMKNVTSLDISDNSVQYLHGLGTMTQLQHLYMNNLDSPGSVIASSLSCLDTSHLVTWQARNISMQSSDLANILSQR